MEEEPQLRPKETEEQIEAVPEEQDQVPEEQEKEQIPEEQESDKQTQEGGGEIFQEDVIEEQAENETPRDLVPEEANWNSEHELPKMTSAEAVPDEDEGSNATKTTLTNEVIKEFFKQQLSFLELTTPEVLEQFIKEQCDDYGFTEEDIEEMKKKIKRPDSEEDDSFEFSKNDIMNPLVIPENFDEMSEKSEDKQERVPRKSPKRLLNKLDAPVEVITPRLDAEQEIIDFSQKTLAELNLMKERFGAEQNYLLNLLHEEKHRETALKISKNRLISEIETNEFYEKQEKKRLLMMSEIEKKVEEEFIAQNLVLSGENSEASSKLDDSMSSDSSTSVYNAESATTKPLKAQLNSYSAHKLQNISKQLDQQLSDLGTEFRNLIEKTEILEDFKRQNKLKIAHTIEMFNKKLEYEKNWTNESFSCENVVLRDLFLLEKENGRYKQEKDSLKHQKVFYEKMEEFALDSIVKLVRILKGKDELPNGTYISVARAIDLYSNLKVMVNERKFSIEAFCDFLLKHPEFGLSVPKFEENYYLDNAVSESEDQASVHSIEQEKPEKDEQQNEIEPQKLIQNTSSSFEEEKIEVANANDNSANSQSIGESNEENFDGDKEEEEMQKDEEENSNNISNNSASSEGTNNNNVMHKGEQEAEGAPEQEEQIEEQEEEEEINL